MRTNSTKIALTNIAYAHNDRFGAYEIMQQNNITGVEVALPQIADKDWDVLTPQKVLTYKQELQNYGFSVPAVMSILLNKRALQVFDESTHKNMINHLKFVAEHTAMLGAPYMVFGAGGNRLVPQGMLSGEVNNRAVDFFGKAAEACYVTSGVGILIEPTAHVYGCNFVNTLGEGAALVEAVDHPGFGLHIDSSSAASEGDQLLPEIIALSEHFHISQLELTGFNGLGLFKDNTHDIMTDTRQIKLIKTMQEFGYKGWFSVEMLPTEGQPLEAVIPKKVISTILGCRK